MIKVIKTTTRPNNTIPFFEDIEESPAGYKQYINDNFIANKKMIKTEHSRSKDGLVITTVMTWSDEDSFLDLCTDEYCANNYHNKVNQYNILNGIASEVIIIKPE